MYIAPHESVPWSSLNLCRYHCYRILRLSPPPNPTMPRVRRSLPFQNGPRRCKRSKVQLYCSYSACEQFIVNSPIDGTPSATHDRGTLDPLQHGPGLSNLTQIQQNSHLSREVLVQGGARSTPSQRQKQSRYCHQQWRGESCFLQEHRGG